MVNAELVGRLRLQAASARLNGQNITAALLLEAARELEDSAGFRAAREQRPEFFVGIADEYGTIWNGEPGASERIGDLIERPDEQTFEIRIHP